MGQPGAPMINAEVSAPGGNLLGLDQRVSLQNPSRGDYVPPLFILSRLFGEVVDL